MRKVCFSIVFLTIVTCCLPAVVHGAEATSPLALSSSTQAFPGAGPELLVDGLVDLPSSAWASPGSPNWVEIDLGQSRLITETSVAPFIGSPGQPYFYDQAWTIQYRDNVGELQDFANVQKLLGAGTLTGPGISITNGDPGSTSSLDSYKYYGFTFDPVSTQYIRFTVTSGDRDGDSNGGELEVRQAFLVGNPVTLDGNASDAEDGNISSSITWSSNLDGTLGSGAPVTVGSLSIGTHTITARIQDSNGAQSTSTTSVTIVDKPSAVTYSMTTSVSGTGGGTVTSSPAGIDCGGDCSQTFDEGSVVTLTATPDVDSTFVGWSGDPDCTDGSLTMSGARDCTATFDSQPIDTHTLTASRGGTGSGMITSSPDGINCGSDCSQNYDDGTIVDLAATPATGSTFAGWSGADDCSDGKVTMNGLRNCNATFNTQPTDTHTLIVSRSGDGSGAVTSSPAGINCGNDCSQDYTKGTAVALTATAATGSFFTGWSGTSDCRDGKITMRNARGCVATFESQPSNSHTLNVSRIGTGSGTVTSSPAGINCGNDCDQNYAKRTVVTLAATPVEGSVFVGWSGTSDCRDGRVKMNNPRDCFATFDDTPVMFEDGFDYGTAEKWQHRKP